MMKIGLNDGAVLLLAGLRVVDSSSVPISLHHLLGDLLGDLRPDVDDLVVALAVGDQTFVVLLLDLAATSFCASSSSSLLRPG